MLLKSLISCNLDVLFPPRVFVFFWVCASGFLGVEEECGSGGEGKGTVVAITE